MAPHIPTSIAEGTWISFKHRLEFAEIIVSDPIMAAVGDWWKVWPHSMLCSTKVDLGWYSDVQLKSCHFFSLLQSSITSHIRHNITSRTTTASAWHWNTSSSPQYFSHLCYFILVSAFFCMILTKSAEIARPIPVTCTVEIINFKVFF